MLVKFNENFESNIMSPTWSPPISLHLSLSWFCFVLFFYTASVDLIGFHARLTDDVDAPNPKTLVLDRVEYNAGGGYDSTTGIFTAPVTGLYLFLATIGASSRDADANVYIEVNGLPRTGCFSKYSTDVEFSTCHGADRVVKGQQVRIVTHRDNRRIRGGRWTTFTVVLIQREDWAHETSNEGSKNCHVLRLHKQ